MPLRHKFERLLEAVVRGSRNETRDHCLVLLIFRHRLRVYEACGQVLKQVDFESCILHVARLKGGLSTAHPLLVDDIRAIKAWLVERARIKAPGRSFFLSGQRMSTDIEYCTTQPSTWRCINTARRSASPLPFTPHAAPCLRLCSCRPGCGNPAYLGLSRQRNIQHTVQYIAINPVRSLKLSRCLWNGATIKPRWEAAE